MRPCQHPIPALWATSSHWPLANLSCWATQSCDRVFVRAPETRNHLGSSLEPEAFQSALAAFVIPKPLRLLVGILCLSCCCLLWAHPPPRPSLRVHGTQLCKVESSTPKISPLSGSSPRRLSLFPLYLHRAGILPYVPILSGLCTPSSPNASC